MTEAALILKDALGAFRPRYALVLGSGLGGLTDALVDTKSFAFAELPGFPAGGVSGHEGRLVAGMLAGTPVIMLSGRVHYYEQGDAAAMRLPLETLAALGIEGLILTNAAGSLREDMPPGSVMLISDHINYSGMNPLIGEPSDRRFTGMSQAYDIELADRMRQAAADLDIDLAEGVYMWFSGPSFETPAEIRMARILGADAVGMSTVPEVILARFLGLKVAAASVITNFGAGMSDGELGHDETKNMAPVGGRKLAAIVKRMIGGGKP
ncbi:purine-nucleoside phosphorylase [Martelella endophytica]|uniref:Purine nucleoside phosphorylase n=1 Tax=Martelella endophytica TaxID=1486262 RepID=A0A0D5LNV0_MAREN|nr:purine-nucleoside phosphorylase [Martelella endophytica]AJY45826.1 purine nucleoside phosphorylase [Martelella endophytica]